jgi:hypothetical protein
MFKLKIKIKRETMQKYLFLALTLGLTLMVFIAFEQGKPSTKAPIYTEIKHYSPYYIDKRFGGLQIMSKEDKEFKEKPVNIEVFRRLDYLEKTWGQTHLKIENNQLNVLDNNGSIINSLPIKTKTDSNFLHTFYGI